MGWALRYKRGVNDLQILREPAVELARMVARRELSSVELTRFFLARIERFDAQVNAFTHVVPEQALREARSADELVRRAARRGDAVPPFCGVPIGIKDLHMARGTFTRMGSRAFERLYSVTDDQTTRQLKRGGFVVVGKTSTPELGTLPITEPDIHAPTRNPWDLSVTAGGSSGGAAAAVAAGLLPVAQGSDGAGSIRIPASLCNLYGFKPSRGRVPNAYGLDDRHIIYTSGPITRTVGDAAAMMDVMAGISVGKPHWAPHPGRTFAELSRERLPRLRVHYTLTSPLTPTHPDAAAATRRVLDLLASQGHTLHEVAPMEGTLDEFLPIWQRMAAEAPVHDLNDTQPVTRWLAEEGKRLPAEILVAQVTMLGQRVLEWFAGADLVVTPTVAVPPLPIGSIASKRPREAFEHITPLGAFTAMFNLSGQPAASVPAGLSSDNHPLGVQLVGKPFDDATVLAVSRLIESALPWGGRIAPAFRARD